VIVSGRVVGVLFVLAMSGCAAPHLEPERPPEAAPGALCVVTGEDSSTWVDTARDTRGALPASWRPYDPPREGLSEEATLQLLSERSAGYLLKIHAGPFTWQASGGFSDAGAFRGRVKCLVLYPQNTVGEFLVEYSADEVARDDQMIAVRNLVARTVQRVMSQVPPLTPEGLQARRSEMRLAPIRSALASMSTSQSFESQQRTIATALQTADRVRGEVQANPDALAEVTRLRDEIVARRLDILIHDLRAQIQSQERSPRLAFGLLPLLAEGCPEGRRQEVEQVRNDYFDGALRHSRAALGERPDRVFVGSVLRLLAQFYADRAAQIEPLRQEARGRVGAALEAARRLPRESYVEGLSLVTGILAIDPQNADAQGLQRGFQEAQTQLQPTSIARLAAGREGNNLLVQITLKNRAGQAVRAAGQAHITLSLTNQGHDVGMGLYQGSMRVTVESFGAARDGTILAQLTIPCSEIEDPISGQGFGTPAFKNALRENGLGVTISVQFDPVGADRGLTLSEEIPRQRL
jgi:hypothetical protein